MYRSPWLSAEQAGVRSGRRTSRSCRTCAPSPDHFKAARELRPPNELPLPSAERGPGYCRNTRRLSRSRELTSPFEPLLATASSRLRYGWSRMKGADQACRKRPTDANGRGRKPVSTVLVDDYAKLASGGESTFPGGSFHTHRVRLESFTLSRSPLPGLFWARSNSHFGNVAQPPRRRVRTASRRSKRHGAGYLFSVVGHRCPDAQVLTRTSAAKFWSCGMRAPTSLCSSSKITASRQRSLTTLNTYGAGRLANSQTQMSALLWR